MAAPILANWEMTAALKDLADWLVQQGLEDTPVDIWLEAFCNRLVAAGVPLQRVNMTVRAHHPEIGTVAFRWHREDGNERQDFQRSGTAPDDYLKSPIYYLVTGNIDEIRQNLTVSEPKLEFPIWPHDRYSCA